MPQALNDAIHRLLTENSIQPVLLDVGASAGPPAIWDPIAKSSTYLGFDPDLRDIKELNEGQFLKSFVVNKAVTSESGLKEITFHLTKSPYCSSTLQPATDSLSHYLFADLFTVEADVTAPATTISQAMETLGLIHLDWIKTDSQGTDLRIFMSVNAEIRSHVLAVDLEPGLIDAYEGEDLFAEVHPAMLQEGFWLSKLDVHSAVRFKPAVCSLNGLSPEIVETKMRRSPAWVEARYLRTFESISSNGGDMRQYLLLWIFSIMEDQFGFALELAHEYRRRFGKDPNSELMRDRTLRAIGQLPSSPADYRSSNLLRKVARRLKRNVGSG